MCLSFRPRKLSMMHKIKCYCLYVCKDCGYVMIVCIMLRSLSVSHSVENWYQEKNIYVLEPINPNRFNNSYREGPISIRKYNNFLHTVGNVYTRHFLAGGPQNVNKSRPNNGT